MRHELGGDYKIVAGKLNEPLVKILVMKNNLQSS